MSADLEGEHAGLLPSSPRQARWVRRQGAVREVSVEFALGATVAVAVISFLAFLAKTWAGEAVRHKFRRDEAAHAHELRTEGNVLLEEMRKLNTQLQSVQSTANAAFVEGHRVAAEWRVKAVDEFWRMWTEETQKTPLQVQLWDSGSREDRLSVLVADANFLALMKDRSLSPDKALHTDIDRTRPFVGERPPILFRIYRTIVIQISHTMRKHAHGEDTTPWYADEAARNLARSALSNEEFERFLTMTKGHLMLLRNAIEREMLADLRKIISGEMSTAEGLEQSHIIQDVVRRLEAEARQSSSSE